MENNTKNQIIKALDNNDNKSLLELDNSKIKTIKNDVLQQLPLNRDELKSMHSKLKQYRYVDDLKDIKFGSYIRWINLEKDTNIKLTNGGIIIHAKLVNNGVHLVIKTNLNRLFEIKMDSCLIFQKINDQESIILSVMDYLNK